MANDYPDPTNADPTPAPDNEIRHPRTRARKPQATAPQAVEADGKAPKVRTRHPVPSHVRERFVNVGKVYYFPDGAKAFEDHGQRLSTPSENTEVIANLIAIAETRGWQRITVSGSEKFRGEVWRQARLKGIAVRGYAASPLEKARLALRLARTPAAVEANPRPSARQGSAPREPSTREASGELLAFGADRYRHEARGPMSYFMRIRTKEGEHTVWGRDLERAARYAQIRVGDSVRVTLTGRDPVTIRTRDPNSDAVRSEERYRNRWALEKIGPAASPSPLTPPGSAVDDALTVRQAELLAAAHLRPEERATFVQAVRAQIDARRASGSELPAARLRERESEDRAKEVAR